MLSKAQAVGRPREAGRHRCRGACCRQKAGELGCANMTTHNFLTRADVENYGSDLVDFAQRAAAHAMAPHLQNLNAENAELRQQLAREARHRLDQQVAAAIPNYRDIDRDPRWHQWLMTLDPLTGQIRQQLLNDAIASGSVARVSAFFRGFQQEATNSPAPQRSRNTASSKPTYTRDQIAQLYSAHRKGAYAGREAEWARIEADIFRAQHENRVQGVYLTK
jgi:hypothetical protein